MAAYVIRPTEQEWAAIEAFLARCGEGAVVIPPDMVERLTEAHRAIPEDGELVDYDFGGDPDYALDVVYDTEHLFLLRHDDEKEDA
jgi:hypothetical protein